MAQPGGTPVVGPFPAGVDTESEREDYDKLRRRVLWTMPYGLYVVGSAEPGEPQRRNLMTLNWATQLSFDPKLIGIGVERTAYTHELIRASRAFSLNTVARDDRAIIRKFTKPVEVDAEEMTLNGFAFHDGVTGAPILDRAVAYMDCEVRENLDFGGHTLFVGEIVDCGFQADEQTELLRMEDTRMSYGG